MEFLVGAAVIIVILLCIGVKWAQIVMLLLGMIGILIVLLAVFFVFCAVNALRSKRVKATFSQIKKGRNFDCAYYLIDNKEYPNMFPCEVILRDKIYKTDKPVYVRVNYKKGYVFDKNAISAIVVGVVCCVPLSIIIIFGTLAFFGII